MKTEKSKKFLSRMLSLFLVAFVMSLVGYSIVKQTADTPPSLDFDGITKQGFIKVDSGNYFSFSNKDLEDDYENLSENRKLVYSENYPAGVNYFYTSNGLSVKEIIENIKPNTENKFLFIYFDAKENKFVTYPKGPFLATKELSDEEISFKLIPDRTGFMIISERPFSAKSQLTSSNQAYVRSYIEGEVLHNAGWHLLSMRDKNDLKDFVRKYDELGENQVDKIFIQTGDNKFEKANMNDLELNLPYHLAWIKFDNDYNTDEIEDYFITDLAVDIQDEKINFEWTEANSNDVDGYKVYYSNYVYDLEQYVKDEINGLEHPEYYSDSNITVEDVGNDENFTLEDFNLEVPYYFTVLAYNDNNEILPVMNEIVRAYPDENNIKLPLIDYTKTGDRYYLGQDDDTVKLVIYFYGDKDNLKIDDGENITIETDDELNSDMEINKVKYDDDLKMLTVEIENINLDHISTSYGSNQYMYEPAQTSSNRNISFSLVLDKNFVENDGNSTEIIYDVNLFKGNFDKMNGDIDLVNNNLDDVIVEGNFFLQANVNGVITLKKDATYVVKITDPGKDEYLDDIYQYSPSPNLKFYYTPKFYDTDYRVILNKDSYYINYQEADDDLEWEFTTMKNEDEDEDGIVDGMDLYPNCNGDLITYKDLYDTMYDFVKDDLEYTNCTDKDSYDCLRTNFDVFVNLTSLDRNLSIANFYERLDRIFGLPSDPTFESQFKNIDNWYYNQIILFEKAGLFDTDATYIDANTYADSCNLDLFDNICDEIDCEPLKAEAPEPCIEEGELLGDGQCCVGLSSYFPLNLSVESDICVNKTNSVDLEEATELLNSSSRCELNLEDEGSKLESIGSSWVLSNDNDCSTKCEVDIYTRDITKVIQSDCPVELTEEEALAIIAGNSTCSYLADINTKIVSETEWIFMDSTSCPTTCTVDKITGDISVVTVDCMPVTEGAATGGVADPGEATGGTKSLPEGVFIKNLPIKPQFTKITP